MNRASFLLLLEEGNKEAGSLTWICTKCTVSSVTGLIVILSETKMETKKRNREKESCLLLSKPDWTSLADWLLLKGEEDGLSFIVSTWRRFLPLCSFLSQFWSSEKKKSTLNPHTVNDFMKLKGHTHQCFPDQKSDIRQQLLLFTMQRLYNK